MTRRLAPHPDRLLPPDPGVRRVARTILDAVAGLPIVSPHGHIDARLLLDDRPFRDPTSLLVSPDHYVFRMLHAAGVPLETLGVGGAVLDADAARAAWRTLCEHWTLFRGTPVRYWLEQQLAEIFEVTDAPAPTTADAIYDRIADRLAQPGFRPRALFDRFGIEVLATTDDPCADLAAHDALRADPSFAGRVVPTFRPDRHLDPGPGWPAAVIALGEAAGIDTSSYDGYIAALEARRRYFVAHGAVSADHGHPDASATPLDHEAAEVLFRDALAGAITDAGRAAFRGHMLAEMARMSCDDGLVMTLHPGVFRNHHPATSDRFGPDTGHDIPVRTEFTRSLQPLLARYGTVPGFHLVLFTVDETTFSREIAPLAGFYPSVFAGAPWWFLDAPDAIRRYRAAVTETIGFERTSGFIDDTRAFCSIPARHDMARRVDAGYLAGLVAEHRLEEDEAVETARALVVDVPRRTFKL